MTKLTTAYVDALKPGAEQQYEIGDDDVRGLRLCIYVSGVKTWIFRYRLNGQQKLTLGQYPGLTLKDARVKARKARSLVDDDISPQAQKQAARAALKVKAAEQGAPLDLIETVARTFVARHVKAKRPRSSREVERILEHDILPQWGRKRLSSITRADVHVLLDSLVDRAPILANRALGVLKTMGRWARERGIVETNPFADLRKPAPEVARDRVLSPAEIAALWSVLPEQGYPIEPLVKLLLMLGQRRSEIAEARWPEFDLDARLWRLPRERSKGGVERTLPLPDDVVNILQKLDRFEGTDFVFSFDGLHPVTGFQTAKARIDKAMAVKLGVEAVEPFVLHDLRRSCASGMASLSVAPHIVEAVLGHRSGTVKGVAAVYNRYSYQAEQLAALTAWARRIREIETGEAAASNVVDLAAARAGTPV